MKLRISERRFLVEYKRAKLFLKEANNAHDQLVIDTAKGKLIEPFLVDWAQLDIEDAQIEVDELKDNATFKKIQTYL